MEKKSIVTVAVIVLSVLLVGVAIVRTSRDSVPQTTKQMTQEQRLDTLESVSKRTPSARNVVDTQEETQKALREVQNDSP